MMKIFSNIFTMKYIGSCFLALLLFVGCSYPTKHLENLKKINGNIDVNGWDVSQSLNMGAEDFFSLNKICGDTIFHLSFSCFKNDMGTTYYIDDFYKTYKSDGYFYQIALQNSDTLYCFRTKFDVTDNLPEICDIEFFTGKYYFLYKMNSLTWGQQKYFEANRDSLTQIKGDDLRPLPEICDSIESNFILPEETTGFERDDSH